MTANFSIGFVARQTGCTVPTIRYYEETGLLPPAARTEAGQRQFDDRTIRRLSFIRRCRDFGFPIEQVRELVGLIDAPDRPCVEARDIAASHLADVRRKLDELKALEASLCDVVCNCESACIGGPALDCSILEDLAVPAGQVKNAPAGEGGCCSS